MKLLKTLAVGAIALACVGSSYATTVKVTGSSAFRKALYAAIINQLGGGNPASVKVAYVGSSGLSGANQAVFTNGTDYVQACIAGSVGGVKWIVNGQNVATVADFDSTYAAKTATAWLKTSNADTGSAPTIGAAPGYALGGGTVVSATTTTCEAAAPADFAMSDSLQDSTPYDSSSTGVALVQATGANLGVVQFVFAKGKADNVPSASAFTNMTALGFQNLATQGVEKLSAFTGVASDDAYLVALVGRDNDSGTRLGTAFETGFGNVNTAIKQYRALDAALIDVGSGTGAGSINSLAASFGVTGYSSGGHVKNVLNASLVSTAKISGKPFIVVAYIGTGDKPTVASQVLTYNGVAQSDAATQNGQYTFWTYEQAYYKDTLDTTKAAIVELIAGDIANTYAPAAGGVLMSTMKADRAGEGQAVFRL